jgi:hypothetical protein
VFKEMTIKRFGNSFEMRIYLKKDDESNTNGFLK